MAELPSGTVTFLFTDLEGSTRLWEQHPERDAAALERHDALLRDAVSRHGGRVVKTTGDGLHAVFVTTRDALDAALAAQQRPRRRAVGGAGRAAGADGPPHRRRRRPRRRLLRPRDQPGRPGDGGRARRAGRGVARHRGDRARHAARRGRAPRPRRAPAARPRAARAHLPGRRPGLRRDFPPLRSLDAMPGNLPRTAHVVRRARGGAGGDRRRAARVAARHRHRRRRCGQEPPRDPGRARHRPPLPRRRVAVRARDRAATTTSSRRWWPATLGVSATAGHHARRRACSTRCGSRRARPRVRQLRAPRRSRAAGSPRRSCASARQCASWPPAARRLGVAGEQVWPLRGARACPPATASTRRDRGERRGAALRRARPRGAARLHARRCERGRGRRDLSPARRHPARGRARRGAGHDHDARPTSPPGSTSGSSCSPAGAAARPSATRRCAAAIEWSYELLDDRERAAVRAPRRVPRQRSTPTRSRRSPPATASRRGTCSTPARAWWRSR